MLHLFSFLSGRRARGLALFEILLALAVGATVLALSNAGLNRYTESVQVQATATQLKRIISSADTWATDNYETVLAEAPRIYSAAETQTRLNPYLGGGLSQDAYRNSYRMATRRYNYTVPDPATGANTTRQALQVLVIGFNTNPTALATSQVLRINIANTSGGNAGFVSTAVSTCQNAAGARLPAGNICGAFGSYALGAGQFPANSLNNAYLLGLVTKGDSSFYGDQLYRYDYGDPDLNTMRTTLLMDSATNANEIQSPRRSITVTSGTDANPNAKAALTIGRQSAVAAERGDIVIDPGSSNRVVVNGNGVNPSLKSNTNVLMMGDRTTNTLRDSANNNRSVVLGSDQTRSAQLFANLVGTNEVSTLWRRGDTPLRLQQFPRGEVIIGQRARYSPRNQGAVVPNLNYEISDGRLVAGHVVSQDITCADCGGSLSQILPKWRHMGTYFVGYTNGAGTRVPHPACGATRRNLQVRGSTSDEQAFSETTQDTRYRPAILLIPRQIKSKNVDESVIPTDGNGSWGSVPVDAHFRAVQPAGLAEWNVILHKPTDNVFSTAFALTYCVFTGGAAGSADPTSASVPAMFEQSPASGIGSWTALP